MSDEEEVPELSREKVIDLIRDVRDTTFPFDPTLENLVAFLNLMDGTEIGVTLHVKGSVISGMLISGRKYFQLLIENLQNMDDEDENSAGTLFGNFFKPQLETFDRDRVAYQEARKLPERPRHIHLRHAQTFAPGEQPLPPMLWRGRLTEIDGWAIGNFGRIAPLDESA